MEAKPEECGVGENRGDDVERKSTADCCSREGLELSMPLGTW